jgi:hypothetical protein
MVRSHKARTKSRRQGHERQWYWSMRGHWYENQEQKTGPESVTIAAIAASTIAS